MIDLEEQRKEFKELANNKSSKDCTFEEKVKVYKSSKRKNETPEERWERITAFRCGW